MSAPHARGPTDVHVTRWQDVCTESRKPGVSSYLSLSVLLASILNIIWYGSLDYTVAILCS